MRKILFMTAALLTAAAYSAQGGEAVRYTVEDAQFEGYRAAPAGPSSGTIVLLPTWNGLSQFETDRAETLADMGFDVFVGDLYPVGNRPATMEAKQAALAAHLADQEGMHAIIRAAVAASGAHTDTPTILMGYSMGAITAMEAAWSGLGNELGVDAYAIFSGRVSDLEGRIMPDATGPFFVAHGEADTMIQVSGVTNFADDVELSGSSVVIHVFPGAGHLFSAKGSPNYNADAAAAAWDAYTAFLMRLTG